MYEFVTNELDKLLLVVECSILLCEEYSINFEEISCLFVLDLVIPLTFFKLNQLDYFCFLCVFVLQRRNGPSPER
jgi:hypothetical protein